MEKILYLTVKHKKTNQNIYLLIKQAPERLRQIPFWKTLFATEIEFYDNTWPVLDQFQKAYSIGFDKIPKCLATSTNEGNEQIVLEDLNYQNFKMYDKTKPLDKEHLEYIFKSYGVYHAISYAFREMLPEQFTTFSDALRKCQPPPPPPGNTDRAEALQIYVDRNMEYIQRLFDKNSDRDIIEVLKKLSNESLRLYTTARLNYKGNTPVLIHGDGWNNNMMFKYSETGSLVDIRFLDFQRVITSSPVHDLSYCFYAGASKENLDKLDEFLEKYLASFCETLKKINCQPSNPLTFEKLKSEWVEYSKFGLIMAIFIWRLKLADRNHLIDVGYFKFDELYPIAKEYINDFNKIIKDLVVHGFENNYFGNY